MTASRITKLSRSTLEIDAAEVGAPNPLPPVGGMLGAPYELRTDDLPPDIVEATRWGHVPNVFPYAVLDGYTRDREARAVETLVLENDRLRATILPGFGGRLWSLVDLRTGRDLVHRNPILQPANLALRGAWISGGVEWNIGTRGHSPHTVSPVFTARYTSTDGSPGIRIWEYERIRGLVYQLDLELPHGSPVLYVHGRVSNPAPETVPLYWWTNVAVPQPHGTRIIAPASHAFHTSYAGEIERLDAAADARWTYPARSEHAGDWFFDMPVRDYQWAVSIDDAGRGLALASTGALRGRKLFCWGRSAGGRRWNEWLCGDGERYAELQAGGTRTQYEHLPLPANAEWCWTEAYALVAGDPAALHSGSWSTAVAAAEAAVHDVIPPEGLAATHEAGRERGRSPVAEMLTLGSGWGALERIRREFAAEPDLTPEGVEFPASSLTGEQAPWLTLLRGAVSMGRPETGSWVHGDWWLDHIRHTEENGHREYLLATIHHARGELVEAEQHYWRALKHGPDALACRGLGLLRIAAGDAHLGADLLWMASRQAPEVWQLAGEAARSLAAVGRLRHADEILARAERAIGTGAPGAARLRLERVRLATAAGDVVQAEKLFAALSEVPDVREGDTIFDEVWPRIHADLPLPHRFDFRMRAPR